MSTNFVDAGVICDGSRRGEPLCAGSRREVPDVVAGEEVGRGPYVEDGDGVGRAYAGELHAVSQGCARKAIR